MSTPIVPIRPTGLTSSNLCSRQVGYIFFPWSYIPFLSTFGKAHIPRRPLQSRGARVHNTNSKLHNILSYNSFGLLVIPMGHCHKSRFQPWGPAGGQRGSCGNHLETIMHHVARIKILPFVMPTGSYRMLHALRGCCAQIQLTRGLRGHKFPPLFMLEIYGF